MSPNHNTIIIVDDEECIRRFVVRILSTSGYNILEAHNAEQALALAETNDFDLLLTDIVMPGMDGIELAELISKKRPHSKILFMSGYSGKFEKNTNACSEEINFIQKPFKISDLIKLIKTILIKTTPRPDPSLQCKYFSPITHSLT